MAPKTPPLDQQLEEARQRTAALADRVLTADSDAVATRLTADLLVAEEEVARLEQATARLDAIMAERSERKAEAARQQRFRELHDLITREFGSEDAAILESLDKASEALTDLVTRVWRHNRGLKAIIQEIIDLGPAPFSTEANYRALLAGTGQVHLPAHDVFLQEFDVERLAGEALWSAMLAVGPTTGEEREAVSSAQDLAGAVAVVDSAVMEKYNCGRGPLPYSARIRYDAAVVADRTEAAA